VAIDLFLQTLSRTSVAANMRRRLSCSASTLHVGDESYSLRDFPRVVVVGIGKAAVPMFEALRSLIEPELSSQQTIEGVIVGTAQLQGGHFQVQHFLGSHPIPDEGSRVAADAILTLLRSCNESCLVFFLVSGGASAMVESPLDSNITLEETALFHRALVQSGLPITDMNVLRKHFSKVKGGRLAVAAGRATQCTLILSDIPGDALHMVGSGPSLPDPSTIQDCQRLLQANRDALKLPDKLLAFFTEPLLPETPKGDHPAFLEATWTSLLSSDDLCREASALATQLGFEVLVDNSCDDWDYRDAADYLLGRITALHQTNPKVCLISAGEVSVKLSDLHGVGGRNQHFVLECARLIANRCLVVTVLSAGSDGIDGNSGAAGAVCDETTFARARERGLDPLGSLSRFDSFRLFDALGDTVITGPTGQNVRDLRILLLST